MTKQATILVTGSNGFMGQHLVPYLAQHGFAVIAASRGRLNFYHKNVRSIDLPDLATPFDWRILLDQCDVVIHLAGVAHKFAADELYDQVNRQGTENLAIAARACGARQLIFVSSISAQSGSQANGVLTESDLPKPTNSYGRSKLAAEKAVRSAGVPFTILRPVAIYGDGEKGNFAHLRKISRLPVPLPFAAIKAQRSILSIENFNSAVRVAILNARALNEVFIVSNPEPIRVSDLIAIDRLKRGNRALLFPVPNSCLELSFRLIGQLGLWERIGRPLVASPAKLMAIGWEPR
jgi:nucleoside-diphosphate-sugar epimerase